MFNCTVLAKKNKFVFHSSGVILSASSTLIKQKQHKMVVSSCQDSKHCESLAAQAKFCDSFESDTSQGLQKAVAI